MNKCLGCGKCCSNYLPLTDKEFHKLKDIIKEKKLKPTKHLVDKDYYSICPFLDLNRQCIIYDLRPSICSSYTCDKFHNKDFSGLNTKEKYTLYNLRQSLFDMKVGDVK